MPPMTTVPPFSTSTCVLTSLMLISRPNAVKVPLLGDVPYLGNLFKTNTKSANRTELLVFLTPKVVTEKAAVR